MRPDASRPAPLLFSSHRFSRPDWSTPWPPRGCVTASSCSTREQPRREASTGSRSTRPVSMEPVSVPYRRELFTLWSLGLMEALSGFALLMGLFIWRGTLITGRDTDHFEVERRFSLRLAMVLLGILVLVARGDTENGTIWLMLSLAGIGYVAAGLAALGVSRLNEARSDESADGAAVAIGGPIAG